MPSRYDQIGLTPAYKTLDPECRCVVSITIYLV